MRSLEDVFDYILRKANDSSEQVMPKKVNFLLFSAHVFKALAFDNVENHAKLFESLLQFVPDLPSNCNALFCSKICSSFLPSLVSNISEKSTVNDN